MSYADDGDGEARRRALGCLGLGIGLSVVNSFLLLNAATGDCAPNPDGSGCENDSFVRFLMFPGFLIVTLLIFVIAAWRMAKAER